ncbi:MAG: ATP-binding protein [Candidatus Magasanikbacteria bacterium]|nr:ATP-binding protein [Candidatus Magasanikbacteria bacterium]
MNFFSYSGLFAGVTSLILGFFVLSKSRNDNVKKIWGIFCFSVAIWGFGGLAVSLAQNVEQGLFWWKITYLGIIFIPSLFYHFVFHFLELKNRFYLYLFYFFSFFFSILEWTPWANYFFGLKNIAFLFDSLYWVNPPTILFTFFVSFWFFIIYYSHYLLYRAFRVSYGLKREQIRYFFTGMSIAFLGGGASFLPCFGINLYPFLNFAVPFYPIIVAYAIVKHRLMDVKTVLRSYSVYILSLVSILFLAVSANSIFYWYFPDSIYWTNLLVLVFATSFFASIKNRYFKLANKYFFSSLYDPQKLIASLSDKLRTTLDIDTIYNYLFELLDEAFHFKNFAVLSYSEKNNSYYLEFNRGFDVGKKIIFQGSVVLHSELISKNKVIFTDEAKLNYYNEESKEVIDLLVNLKIEVLIPLNVKNKTVGLIALGKKESGDSYNDSDLQILEIVGAQAATVIENAYLYEKTLNFNLKLKEEVERATRDLVVANKKLIKLDEAKSEFISIASHQLRTPLTIIKGYISMILEGNFGELTPGEKESLDKVYASNERLIQLVENLLNISRIESGRLQFDYRVMQLETIVDSVIEELEPKAKGKGLKFTYKKTKKKLPAINIDEEKIRQVVMNLVDNAIKYTRKGNVTVTLVPAKSRDPKIGDCLQFSVSDSGMGISSEDLPNLFKKFSRGTGSSLVHTEGTGLGLYVARQMIEAHRGRIWAESKGENKGSKFCFKISAKNTPPVEVVDEKRARLGKKAKKVKV